MPAGYCSTITYLHKTTGSYVLANIREISFLPHHKRSPFISNIIRSKLDFHSHGRTGICHFLHSHKQRDPCPTRRRNTWHDMTLAHGQKVNSNSLFCISKYIIKDLNHKDIPFRITLRSIVCIEIISTHSSVGLHLCIAGTRIEP